MSTEPARCCSYKVNSRSIRATRLIRQHNPRTRPIPFFSLKTQNCQRESLLRLCHVCNL